MPIRLLCAALLACALALPAAAQNVDEGRFDVILRGVTAGQLAFRGQQEGGGYAVSGRLQSTGLVGALVKFAYDAQVQGATDGVRYAPSRYTERSDTGRRSSTSVIRFRNGTPQVEEVTPPRAPGDRDVDPATQRGSVDPLTALYAILRDVDATQACTTRLNLFDGRRATGLALADPQLAGDGAVTCRGEYRRVAGFSPEDMAERSRFPFVLTYRPVGEGRLRVTEIRTSTTYGDAILRRR